MAHGAFSSGPVEKMLLSPACRAGKEVSPDFGNTSAVAEMVFFREEDGLYPSPLGYQQLYGVVKEGFRQLQKGEGQEGGLYFPDALTRLIVSFIGHRRGMGEPPEWVLEESGRLYLSRAAHEGIDDYCEELFRSDANAAGAGVHWRGRMAAIPYMSCLNSRDSSFAPVIAPGIAGFLLIPGSCPARIGEAGDKQLAYMFMRGRFFLLRKAHEAAVREGDEEAASLIASAFKKEAWERYPDYLINAGIAFDAFMQDPFLGGSHSPEVALAVRGKLDGYRELVEGRLPEKGGWCAQLCKGWLCC